MRLRICMCFVAAVLTVGCGGLDDEPERRVVSGTVTFEGQPVAEGNILFRPAEGTEAPSSGGPIRNGKFSVEHKGGVPVGDHTVIITATRPVPGAKPYTEETAPPGEKAGAVPTEQFIPSKYSTPKSELNQKVESGSEALEVEYTLTAK